MVDERMNGIGEKSRTGFKRKIRICIAIGALIAFGLHGGSTALAITIRHDVAEGRYIRLGQAAHLKPGLVVTRPDAPVPGSGVLVHKNFVLTAGHVGSVNGPAAMPIVYLGKRYTVDYVSLFPGYDGKAGLSGGNDLALLHIQGEGIIGHPIAQVWTGGVEKGQIFEGVGYGKSGTGKQSDEPLPGGKFRGYQNTVDVVLDDSHWNMLIADFDGPDNAGNSLAAEIFHTKARIAGDSSGQPLPLEGTLAAGDSGSGIWARKQGRFYLIGIATGRYYSSYGGQSMYVNLSHPQIAQWMASVIEARDPTH